MLASYGLKQQGAEKLLGPGSDWNGSGAEALLCPMPGHSHLIWLIPCSSQQSDGILPKQMWGHFACIYFSRKHQISQCLLVSSQCPSGILCPVLMFLKNAVSDLLNCRSSQPVNSKGCEEISLQPNNYFFTLHFRCSACTLYLFQRRESMQREYTC